jgi:putative transposase
MIDKVDKTLSVSKQCVLLQVNRSSIYYTPSCESEENLRIMRWLDEQYLSTPFYGVNKLLQQLFLLGFIISPKRLRRLMRLVGWQTLYPQRNTTRIDLKKYKYPYLLRDLKIERPNQAWAIDITYIPMEKGFMYLFAIIDLYSRYVVGWSVSNTMTAQWCVDTIEQAIAEHGKPEIINSDQGTQFTSDIYTDFLKDNKIRISMDGKGRAIDNVFIERLWRSVKYEHIYLHVYQTGNELWRGLDNYFQFYNKDRLHQNLNYKTPCQYYSKAA